jgi:hypothetical protein
LAKRRVEIETESLDSPERRRVGFRLSASQQAAMVQKPACAAQYVTMALSVTGFRERNRSMPPASSQ